jgi:hypothetical protein
LLNWSRVSRNIILDYASRSVYRCSIILIILVCKQTCII